MPPHITEDGLHSHHHTAPLPAAQPHEGQVMPLRSHHREQHSHRGGFTTMHIVATGLLATSAALGAALVAT